MRSRPRSIGRFLKKSNHATPFILGDLRRAEVSAEVFTFCPLSTFYDARREKLCFGNFADFEGHLRTGVNHGHAP